MDPYGSLWISIKNDVQGLIVGFWMVKASNKMVPPSMKVMAMENPGDFPSEPNLHLVQAFSSHQPATFAHRRVNSSKYPIKYPSSHQWIITINIYWTMNFPWNILTTNVPWSFPWNIGKSHDFQQADNSDTSAELARLRGVAGVSVDCASGLALRKRMAKKLSSMFHWLLFKLTIPPYGCRIYLQSNSWPWHRCQVPWKKRV